VKFKLCMDEDSLHRDVFEALTRAGFDCLTVTAAGRSGLPDDEQLGYSTEASRVILTRNARDFVRLHDEWSTAGRSHAGIIVLTSRPISVGEIQRAVTAIAELYDADRIRGQLVFLRNHL